MHETTGLRERKKAETRAAISQAVMGLAVERGLDAMTSDDIAAAANVSVRTFHNYFGSKEEALAAAWRSEFQVHVDALRDRPADEPILVSLEHVFAGIAAAVLHQPDEAAAHVDMLWTSMALAKHRSVLIDEAIRMVTDVVAARTGTDPDYRRLPPPRDLGRDLRDRHDLPVRAGRQHRRTGPGAPAARLFRAAPRGPDAPRGGSHLTMPPPGA